MSLLDHRQKSAAAGVCVCAWLDRHLINIGSCNYWLWPRMVFMWGIICECGLAIWLVISMSAGFFLDNCPFPNNGIPHPLICSKVLQLAFWQLFLILSTAGLNYDFDLKHIYFHLSASRGTRPNNIANWVSLGPAIILFCTKHPTGDRHFDIAHCWQVWQTALLDLWDASVLLKLHEMNAQKESKCMTDGKPVY